MGPQLWYRCKIPSMALHLTSYSFAAILYAELQLKRKVDY
jgi:hypothetical protein